MREVFVSWMEGRLKVGPSQTMTSAYSPVPTEINGMVKKAGGLSGICSSARLTKTNLIALFSIALIACVFIIFACVGGSWFHKSQVCPDHHSFHTFTVAPKTHTGQNRIRYKHTSRKLPHCIIIGVRKAGTRALLEYLEIHPDIQVASQEIHFFDDQQNYSQGLTWYRKRMPFSFPDQLTIEKTPNYFVDDKAPGRIQMMNSSIKIILIVRDPLYRSVSDYAQIREGRIKQGMDMENFEDLAINPDTDKVNIKYKAVSRSLYYIHMERWLKYFPLSQFHIVDGDRLVRCPYNEVRKVETFLGLEHKITKNSFYYDRQKGFYCIWQSEQKHKCLAKSKGRKHPPIDPDITRQLNNFFSHYNEKFFKLINRTFRWPLDENKKYFSDCSLNMKIN